MFINESGEGDMLKAARTLLSGLNVLNWAVGILFIVFAALVTLVGSAAFIEVAEARNIAQPDALLNWLGWSAILMVPMIIAVHFIFTRLIRIIDSAGIGQAFSIANAERLTTIAWALLVTQLIDLAAGVLSTRTSALTGEYLGWSPSFSGLLAFILLFILARIFREGAAMREELEGTV
jgi:hypothetical protein